MATKKTTGKTASKTTAKKPTSKRASSKPSAPKATTAQKSATTAKKTSKPAWKASTPKKATHPNTAATSASKKPGKVSLLDAAVQVLTDAKKPMRCKAIVEAILKNGEWKTSGKTPHATLYSSMLREIQNKGADSRFKKTDRGLFMLKSK